jgi:hypothetical protein
VDVDVDIRRHASATVDIRRGCVMVRVAGGWWVVDVLLVSARNGQAYASRVTAAGDAARHREKTVIGNPVFLRDIYRSPCALLQDHGWHIRPVFGYY